MGTQRTALALAAGILLAGQALATWDFDHRLAESYAGLFAPATAGRTGKSLHCVEPEALLKWLMQGEPVTGLDIRTPAETAVFGLALPDSLHIPLNELFTPEHLDQVPQDRKVIVLCQSGMRAGMAVMALRHLGYDQVYVLQGGYKGLTSYLEPVTAYAQAPSLVPSGRGGVIPGEQRGTVTSGQAGVVTSSAAGDQPPASLSAPRQGRNRSQVPSPLSPLVPPSPGGLPGLPEWSTWNPSDWRAGWSHPLMEPWPAAAGTEGYPSYGYFSHRYPGWRSGRAYPHWRTGPGPRSWHGWRWPLTRPSPPLAPPPSPPPLPPALPGPPVGMPPP